MVGIINKIEEKFNFENSAFKENMNYKNYSCCLILVVPFSEKGLDKHETTRIDECRRLIMQNKKTLYGETVKEETVKELMTTFEYDELIIEKEDYEKLIEKSNRLKIIYGLENSNENTK